jgi:hypothetical protein
MVTKSQDGGSGFHEFELGNIIILKQTRNDSKRSINIGKKEPE